MKKVIALAVLVLATFVGVSSAQSETAVGVQYTRSYPVNTDRVGVVASHTKYLTPGVGVTAEGSASFTTGGARNSQLYTAFGGLTYKYRKSATVQPFIKGVAGIAAVRVKTSSYERPLSDESFGWKTSAGVDVGSGRIKFRPFEVGYMQTNFYNKRQDYLVIGTGLTF